MVVVFEFLNDEPIENVITMMNFRVDKVVFFGYQDVVERESKRTENFLKKYCEVQNVEFHSLSRIDLQSTLLVMRKEVQTEQSQENKVYFDITGGESLILTAFGMLSREIECPMHMYDIENDKVIELENGSKSSICQEEYRKIPMTLKLLIRMHGGKINRNMHKGIKSVEDVDLMNDVEKIYRIAQDNWDYWNPFSNILHQDLTPVTNLQVSKRAQTVIAALNRSNTKLKSINKLNEIIDQLESAGILTDVVHSDGYYKFTYKSKEIKECLWEGGSILELHTCLMEARNSSECQVGVHLDWDGVIHEQAGVDVLNEIDVLSLRGNIPVFCSCKSGKMNGQQALHALYELDTVANRFGGKYAKKVLVTAKGLSDVYMERAREMGIEVR